MRSILLPLGLLTLAITVLSTGCARPAAQADNPTTLAVADRDFLRRAITDVLQEMFFEVETPPRSEDRIDTLPLVSAYPFEFWRPDTRTSYDKLESALHTVRRTVTVTMKAPQPAASGSSQSTLVEVEVRKQRVDLEEGVQATTVGESYSVFSSRVATLERFEKHWGQGIRWVDAGRDRELENYILAKIRRRF